MAEIARDLVGVLLGEAGGKTPAQRYKDFVGIASVVANRAAATGKTVQEVISAPNQFGAYGRALPKGVEKLDALARMAIDQVSSWGPTTNSTYYATPDAVSNLPTGLNPEDQSAAHQFFSDPKNRSIRTSAGYVTPDPEAMAMGYAAEAPNSVADAQASAELSNPGAARVSYSHPERGAWNSGLSPDMTRAVSMLGANLPDGVSINSAYRSPSVNKSVGGAKNSQHLYGDAVDIDLSGMTNDERAKAVETARMTGATRQIAYEKSPNMLHIDFADYAPNVNVDTYAMMDKSAANMARAPGWFTQGLTQTTVPTPTPRPAFDTAIAQAAPAAMAAQSVQSMSVPGTPDIGVDTNVGFFAGKPGKVAGVPAQSVKSTSYTPDMAMADAAPATLATQAAEAFSDTTQSPSSRALADLAAKADDQSISEIAGTQVGAVAPSNAYATTNLPSVAPSINPNLAAAVAPAPVAPVTVTPQPTIRPPAVPAPKITAPTIAAPQTRAPQSMPSGVQAAMDFHAGINNAAMASNGNTLTRDALGNSYNYSPSFDVTTISDPTGRTVGVKQGKVSPDMAGPSAASASAPGTSKGLFSGIGDTIKDTFSNDNVSNAVVGGLGGLGGAAVGSLLGPVGSMVGSAIGRSLAVQHNPFASQPGTFTVNTFQGPMTFASPIGGLGGLGGFPSAPRGAPGALGGTQSNRSTGEMRGMSPRAADAIGKGVGGLY